jgi:hypothetical protein
MAYRSHLAGLVLSFMLTVPASADVFDTLDKPTFAGISSRLVYGFAQFDLSFAGNPKNSAERFLKSISEKKFSRSNGNYIVTLELTMAGRKLLSEPIISARWERDKFLFLTTSVKTAFEAQRDGVLLENFVIDNETNKVEIKIRAYFSNQLNIDFSLFKEIADLSKTATLSALVPGAAQVAAAYESFSPLLEKLLSRYEQSDIVEEKTGVFTLLDEGFGNKFKYSDGRVTIHIYLNTKESQLAGSFEKGKFTTPDFELALATVKAGVGAARARVLDIIAEDDAPQHAELKSFVTAISTGAKFREGPGIAKIRQMCGAMKDRFNSLVTTRDASLLYWAFLRKYRNALQSYPDAFSCADATLTESLTRNGLALSPVDWPPTQ